ncbi:hypothetical protein J2S94_003079 [Arthrobacter bambusae]|nr:hypothetical protein [Arthrobacter bambusae]
MQCCSSYPVRMMATREDPGGWPEGAIFNVALVGSPCKLPSKAGARPATGARASEPLSRAKKPTSRCKMPNISPGAIERDVSAQCLPARLTVYPAQVHRWIIFSQSLVSSFFKVSDRKATADAAQEGTESLGAEARIYADRHPKLIDRGCITPVSAETRRLDASSRHRRRRLDTPGSACDEPKTQANCLGIRKMKRRLPRTSHPASGN